jgi:hypothetical protein
MYKIFGISKKAVSLRLEKHSFYARLETDIIEHLHA